MTDTILREKIVLDGADEAARKLGLMSVAAGRLGRAFHGITELAGAATGIAGAWKIVETVQEVDRLYQSIGRVKDMTGIAAQNAHAMFNMFELSGMGADTAEEIITSMTRKGQQLGAAMEGVGGRSATAAYLMRRLGISMKLGPEERLYAMAKAAEKGKIGIDNLVMGFAIPRSQASQMLGMLRQGPDALKKIHQDAISGASIIDDRTLASYQKMLQVRRELGAAWGDLVNVFYKNLIPVITEVLKEIKKGFDDIAPIAESIGKFLKDHMTAVVALAKTWLALTIANRAINMVTGGDSSMFGKGRSAVGGVLGFFQKKRAANVAMDYFEAKAASPGAGMFSSGGAGFGSIVMGLIRGIGPAISGFGASLAGLIPALVAMGPVLLAIAAVVGIVLVAFELFRKNFLGLGDALKSTVGTLVDHLKAIGSKLVDILVLLWNAIKPVLAIVGTALLVSLTVFAWWLGKLAWLIEKIIDFSMMSPGMLLLKKFGDLFDDKKEVAKEVDDGKRGSGKPPGINMDFRGSKFEITNNFPPGIDGGRVAVAFSDELAALGERRLDSGVRPLFSFR